MMMPEARRPTREASIYVLQRNLVGSCYIQLSKLELTNTSLTHVLRIAVAVVHSTM
jgi:hypothetical protein